MAELRARGYVPSPIPAARPPRDDDVSSRTDPRAHAALVLDGIEKRFAPPPAPPVLSGFSLDVAGGEVLALLGPSGSGKTTVLRTVAGFESPERGRVLLGGEDVTRLPPERRNFGMVFQHYALFPHLTVGGNVAFGLQGAGRGLGKDAMARRVDEVLAL